MNYTSSSSSTASSFNELNVLELLASSFNELYVFEFLDGLE